MRIAAIIAEYNPFHNGHLYHIQQTKEQGKATHIVAIMRPNFVQRGETALLEKSVRTRAALEHGVDLVLELPTPYVLSNASIFARAGAEIIHAMGCVDAVSFGSESGNEKQLSDISNRLLTGTHEVFLKEHLASGLSFVKAQALAIEKAFGEGAGQLLEHPNDVLATEYIRALKIADYHGEILAVKRRGTEHDGEEPAGVFASASAIRKMMSFQSDSISQKYVPCNAFLAYREDFVKNHGFSDLSRLERMILDRLRGMTDEEWREIPDVSEGIENRIRRSAEHVGTLEELYHSIKSKRYLMARIKRIVCCSLIGITKQHTDASVPYLHILGFNKKGEEILTKMKKTALLPFSVSLKTLEQVNSDCRKLAEIESRSTDVFGLTMPAVFPAGLEYRRMPIKL